MKTLNIVLLIAVFLIAFTACSDDGPVSVTDNDSDIAIAEAVPNASDETVYEVMSMSFEDHFSDDFEDVTDDITTIPDDALVGWQTVNFGNNEDACALHNIDSEFGGKIDTGEEGTYPIPDTDIDVTLTHLGENTYEVSVEEGFVLTNVFLKHKQDFNEWYQFYPWASSASGMMTGQNAVSHFSVCVDEAPQPLEISKTAAGTYDRTVEWTLEKSVDEDSFSGMLGDEFEWEWTVEATKSETLDNYQVTGTITIDNPNNFPVAVTVTDELDDGTVADVDCSEDEVPANGSLECSYSADPEDDSATENTVTVVSGVPAVDGGTANADVSWTENLIGFDEGTLTDDLFDYEELINSSTTVNFDDGFVCTSDLDYNEDGIFTTEIENIAELNDDIDLEDSATVTVQCELPKPLEISKTSAGTYDRTVEWTLDKSVDIDSHTGMLGELAGSSIWNVEATKSETLDNYQVAGTITIENPNSFEVSVSISDELDDGTVATGECLGEQNVPAYNEVDGNGIFTCDYTADPENDDATENTVTVVSNVDGVDGGTANADVSWTENLIGFDEGTLTDDRVSYSELISSSTTELFPEDFYCSANIEDYTDGTYSYTETNTAELNGNLNLEDSATVTVTCNAPDPETETAWAANGDDPLTLPYNSNGRGNWATYVEYDGVEKSVKLFAGKTTPVGTVDFSAPIDDDYIEITITLEGDWFYDPGSIIAIQDYDSAPSGNPPPGRFDHKFNPGEPIMVPMNEFYGIHAVVATFNP